MPSNFKFICILFITLSNNAYSFDTHCENERNVIFNCKVKNSEKLISVCRVAIDGSHGEEYLQYKYGKLKKVELTYPHGSNVNEGQFSYRRFYSRNSGTREYDLFFKIKENQYNIVFHQGTEMDENEKTLGEVTTFSGITVIASNGKRIYLECSKDVIEKLDSATVFNVKEVEELDDTR